MADRSERIRQQYCSTRVIGAIGTRWEHLMADRVRSPGLKMYLTPATLYAFRLSFQQGTVSSVFRRNTIERHTAKSACMLAIIGLSMSIFSVRKLLASKHNGRL